MDPIFNESWHDLGEHEHGDDFEDLAVRHEEKTNLVYQRIKKLEGHSKMSGVLVRDIEDGIVRYIKAVDKLSLAKINNEEKDEKKRADEARRFAHNALIDSLNILNRYCVKNGLDTGWRNMVGLDRDQVRDWALVVSKKILT